MGTGAGVATGATSSLEQRADAFRVDIPAADHHHDVFGRLDHEEAA